MTVPKIFSNITNMSMYYKTIDPEQAVEEYYDLRNKIDKFIDDSKKESAELRKELQKTNSILEKLLQSMCNSSRSGL